MATIQASLQEAELQLKGGDSARRDAEVMLCHALNKSRVYLFTWPDKELSESECEQFNASLLRRKNGEPIAYILGEKEFWSLSLKVNESTLIPRPDTELLVETTLALLPEQAQSLLDLGTGSGAIALALASERPDWTLIATDKNAGAVALAEDNRQRHQLHNVNVLKSDWFAQVEAEQFHAIISNPPYIDRADKHLSQGDVRFEPLSALVADAEGLSDLRHIATEAWPRLLNGGWLLLEHGYQQGAQVRSLLLDRGYNDVQTRTDIAGQPRITLGKKSRE